MVVSPWVLFLVLIILFDIILEELHQGFGHAEVEGIDLGEVLGQDSRVLPSVDGDSGRPSHDNKKSNVTYFPGATLTST